MTKECFDNTYVVQYTDTSKGTITIPRKSLIDDEIDITLVGKDRIEYGQEFDENMLHLLENFSCPELTGSSPIAPDPDFAVNAILDNPIEGQTWYNSTQERLFVYDGDRWNPLGTNDDVGGNRGVILSGLSLPKPVSPVTGYEFDYSECSWNVSPFNIPGEVDFMECHTDSEAAVTMRYRLSGGATVYDGYANYQIIGIRDNNNQGSDTPILPSGTQLPTPTVTPTPSVTQTIPVTPTITPTNTATPNVTPTVTPTPAVSPGIEFFVSVATDNVTGGTTESIKLCQVGPSSFSTVATNATVGTTSDIRGGISTDGYNLFVPYRAVGTAIFTRTGSDLNRVFTIDNEFGYSVGDALYHNHPTLGNILYTVQYNVDGSQDPPVVNVKIRTYIINGPGSVSTLSTTTVSMGSLVSTSNLRASLCLHNNYLIFVSNERLMAYYHNGVSLNLISTVINANGGYIRARSDNSFIYPESRYNLDGEQPNRKIYTFSGATFSEVYSGSGGEFGLAVGGSNIFTGYNKEAAIQAKYWDGVNLGGVIASVSSTTPAFSNSSLFKFSNNTSRLYNPVDNVAGQSRVYTWNGTSFTTLMTLDPEPLAGTNKYIAFGLMYLSEASEYPSEE